MRALGAAAAAALSAAALLAPLAAHAQLRTCVEVEIAGAASPAKPVDAKPSDAKGEPTASEARAAALTRILKAEIDRHVSTHHAADADCQSYLHVELADLGPVDGQWLTARINSQVPHRERVGPDGLVPAVERLLTVVLNNDPFVLKGPESPGWLRRHGRDLERRSVLHWGAEGYELAAPVDGGLQTLSGVALTMRREVSDIYLGFRVGAAFNPFAPADRLVLRTHVDAQIEGGLYARPAADTSLYLSVLLGLAYSRFQGPAPLDGPGAVGIATDATFAVAVRGGIEAFRTTDLRLFAFAELAAPAAVASDPDHGVVHAWVPTAALGAGLLF
jgi:hypothetical protein